VFQNGFAQAQTRLRAARLLAFESYGAMWSTHTSGQPVSLAQRADATAATTYAYNVSVEVAEFAFRAAGGAALFRDQRLQRCFRDIQAGSQHIVPSEETWERVGQAYLGVGTPAMI
jgi:alkylation response protein AidB-like acyl-CoA dehydrogenase